MAPLVVHESSWESMFLGIYSINLHMKVGKSLNLTAIPGSHLPDGSYLSAVKKIIESVNPSTGRNKWKEVEIVIRVIKFLIPGFQPRRLITSLVDSVITAKDIVIHYHKRRDIEIAYDEIKTHQCSTLKGQLPTIFRSKRSDLVEQGLYAIVITYNLIRSVIMESTSREGGRPLVVRARAKINSHFGISSSAHFCQILKIKKLEIVYYTCAFCSSRSDKPKLNLSAKNVNLFLREPLAS